MDVDEEAASEMVSCLSSTTDGNFLPVCHFRAKYFDEATFHIFSSFDAQWGGNYDGQLGHGNRMGEEIDWPDGKALNQTASRTKKYCFFFWSVGPTSVVKKLSSIVSPPAYTVLIVFP